MKRNKTAAEELRQANGDMFQVWLQHGEPEREEWLDIVRTVQRSHCQATLKEETKSLLNRGQLLE
eukprot:12543848-Prorocentrum_lima.AAC.1